MSYNLREGSRVSYVGNGSDGRTLGERGQILAINGRSGHTKWADGSITLVDLDDVAPLTSTTGAARGAARDELDDSLDVGPIQATGMAGVYQRDGGPGVLNALVATGALSAFATIAEEARAFVEGRVRQDPDICQVTAQLDPEEADELVSLASHVLLRDAFGVPHGE